jgi:hypothetical protein
MSTYGEASVILAIHPPQGTAAQSLFFLVPSQPPSARPPDSNCYLAKEQVAPPRVRWPRHASAREIVA